MIYRMKTKSYEDRLGLTGKDLISLAGARKEQVKTLIPTLLPREEMSWKLCFGERKVGMTGDTPDEIHVLPNAIQGDFRSLELWFREGVPIEFSWRFQLNEHV